MYLFLLQAQRLPASSLIAYLKQHLNAAYLC